MAVGVARDLVAAVKQPPDKLGAVFCAAVGVFFKVGVVVVAHAAPLGRALFAGCVGIVFLGVSHHVERALRAVTLERLGKMQRQGLAVFPGIGRQAAWAVVERHGAHALMERHAFHAAHGGEIYRRAFAQLVLKAVLELFGKADGLCNSGPNSLLNMQNIAENAGNLIESGAKDVGKAARAAVLLQP